MGNVNVQTKTSLVDDVQALMSGASNWDTLKYPDYQSSAGPNDFLKDQYLLKYAPQSMDEIRKRANGSTDANPWVQMMRAQQGDTLASKVGGIPGQAAGQGAAARSSLAMSGGIDPSQQRLLDRNISNMGMDATQDAYANYNMGLNKINTQGEMEKNAFTQALPGMELEALKPQQWNIENAMKENLTKNAAEYNKYKTVIGAYAADKTGGAYGDSGKK